MAIDPSELQRTSGCGVQGCLLSAVVLFIILMVATIFIAVGRFAVMPGGPQNRGGAEPEAPAPRSTAPPISIEAFPPSLLHELALAATPERHA